MSEIPLHLQRRFEQRWAARFVSPIASAAPKSIGLKGTGPLLDGVKKWVAQGIPESEADQDSGHNIGDRITHPLTTPQS